MEGDNQAAAGQAAARQGAQIVAARAAAIIAGRAAAELVRRRGLMATLPANPP